VIEFSFECASRNFCAIRQRLRDFLQPLPLTPEQTTLLVLAVDEACGNILRHAYGGEDCGPLRFQLEVLPADRPTTLRIRIRDYGRSCDPSAIRGRALEDIRPGGLGVHLIRQAFDRVEYQPRKKGTLLVLEKSLPSAPDEAA
jgi:anti-sigma regulatory factor (Ser/Thr protein kinase)